MNDCKVSTMNCNKCERVILKPKRKRLESEKSTTSSGLSQLSTSTQATDLSSTSHLTSEISSVIHESHLGTSQNNCDAASLAHFDDDDDVEIDQTCGHPIINLTRFYLDDKDNRIEDGERSTNFNATTQRTVPVNVITKNTRSQEAFRATDGLRSVSDLSGQFASVTSNIYEPISNGSITTSADNNGYLNPIKKGVPTYNDLNFTEERFSLVDFEEGSDELTGANDFQTNHSEYQCLRPAQVLNSCRQQVGDTRSRCDKRMVVGCHRLTGIVFGIFSIIIIMLNVVVLTIICVSRSHTEHKGGVHCYKCEDENWQELGVTVMSSGSVQKGIWCCLNAKMDFTYLLKELQLADVPKSKYDINRPERNNINDEDLLGRYMGTAYIKLEADEYGKTIPESSGAKIYWKKRPVYGKNITLAENQTSIAIQTAGYYFVYSRIYLSFSPKDGGVADDNSNCRVDIRLMKPAVTMSNSTRLTMIDYVSQSFYVQNFTIRTEHLSVLQCLQYLKTKDEISVSIYVEYCGNVKISTQSSLTMLLISK